MGETPHSFHHALSLCATAMPPIKTGENRSLADPASTVCHQNGTFAPGVVALLRHEETGQRAKNCDTPPQRKLSDSASVASPSWGEFGGVDSGLPGTPRKIRATAGFSFSFPPIRDALSRGAWWIKCFVR